MTDYNQQQQYQTPSSTPSSNNIAHQYRGQINHKQAVELQQVQLQVQEQPVVQQQRNYNQDLYSPPPVIQDFNDQYNVQQVRHLFFYFPDLKFL